MGCGWLIRRTREADCSQLPAIETSAASVFLADPELAHLANGETIDNVRHAELIKRGICLVAVDELDAPIGFIATEQFGSDLHIWELSVTREWQKRGIGRRLLGALEGPSDLAGVARLTLTTFSDLEADDVTLTQIRSC